MTGGALGRGARGWLLGSLAAALCACLGLCACASTPGQTGAVQYLDRDTGATFMIVGRPLTFAHVRPQVAARVRDYATVAAAYLDRGGRIDYVLLVYLWSTIDPRNEPGPLASTADLVLVADDRRIALIPFEDPGQSLPRIDRPPVRHFAAAIFRTDLPTLRYLIAARYLSLLQGNGGEEARFELWDDERASLAQLVRSGQ